MVPKTTNTSAQETLLNPTVDRYQPALTYLAHQALSEASLSRLFQKTVSLVANTLNIDYVRLWQFLSDGQTAKKVASIEKSQLIVSKSTEVLVVPSELKQVLGKNLVIVLTPENGTKDIVKLLPPVNSTTKSGLSVTIPGQDEPLGFIDAYTDKSRIFSDRDINFLEAVSHLLGTAIFRKRLENLLSIQTKILEGLATGTSLFEVYNNLCLLLEEQTPGSYCSILLYDPTDNKLKSGAAPSIPQDYAKALDGLIVREGAGSCGTAAFRGEQLFVVDIANDPLWADFRDFALGHGIGACWSTPFFAQNGDLLGTFAISHQVPTQPTAHHLQIIKTATHLASIANEAFRSTQELIDQAIYDNLTRLPNRAFFINELRGRIQSLEHLISWPEFAVLFLDVDNFKLINDTVGHSIGDQFLKVLSTRLKDLIGHKAILARLGGDEFAVLLEPLSCIGEAKSLAEEIQAAFSYPLLFEEQEVFVSVSIGIVQSSTNYQTPEEILRDADIAMYRAKANGKERSVVFDQTMRTEVLERVQLQAYLRQAVEKLTTTTESQFQLYYQPIVSLETGQISGFEALVRWFQPEKGLISPGVFIPLAEETGLIIPLGTWIFRQACMQLGKWQAQYPSAKDLVLSVNISCSQFYQVDLIEQIKEVLEKTPISPSCIKLEITESLLMDTNFASTHKLEQLKSLGINLSLDDFGTGYSCLSYLYQLPIDTLKIDRSFVQRLEEGETEIVRTIIALAHNLNMNVVAEGVETEKQKNSLKTLGCEFGQGYLFSKPVPPEIIETLLNCQI